MLSTFNDFNLYWKTGESNKHLQRQRPGLQQERVIFRWIQCILARRSFFCYHLFQDLPCGRGCPSKSSKFFPPFFSYETVGHLLWSLPHVPSGMLGKGLLQPPASGGGSAQTRSGAEHTLLLQLNAAVCNAATAPLPSQPTGLRFADRLDVVTQQERPPHCELNMTNIRLACWGSQLWDIHSS